MVEIEHRIARLEEQAARLLERERTTSERIANLQRTVGQAGSRIKIHRAQRALRREEIRLAELQEQRRRLVHDQIRGILFALQEQAQHTRNQLDRQLDRLAPVQEEWERLRATFNALEAAIRAPAFAALAEQWQGQLEIPEFPLAQRAGYTKPFPQHALLF